MNDPQKLFTEIFCNPNNKQTALMYLASLMSVTETEETYRTKCHQIALLKDFFVSAQCSKKNYYLQYLSNIESILEKDRLVGRWDKCVPEEVR